MAGFPGFRGGRQVLLPLGLALGAAAIGGGLLLLLLRTRRTGTDQPVPERHIAQAVSWVTGTADPMDEAALKAKAEMAVRGAAGAEGIEIGVEGRNVYLRGAAATARSLEDVVRRVRAVPGVGAVVNFATVRAPLPSRG